MPLFLLILSRIYNYKNRSSISSHFLINRFDILKTQDSCINQKDFGNETFVCPYFIPNHRHLLQKRVRLIITSRNFIELPFFELQQRIPAAKTNITRVCKHRVWTCGECSLITIISEDIGPSSINLQVQPGGHTISTSLREGASSVLVDSKSHQQAEIFRESISLRMQKMIVSNHQRHGSCAHKQLFKS